MHKPQATLPPLRRLRVITYRVTLDVPLQLVIKVSILLRTPEGTRHQERNPRPDLLPAGRLHPRQPKTPPHNCETPAAGSGLATSAIRIPRWSLTALRTLSGPGYEPLAIEQHRYDP